MKKNIFWSILFVSALVQAEDSMVKMDTTSLYSPKTKYCVGKVDEARFREKRCLHCHNCHIKESQKPILMIGASYVNSKTRIDDNGIGSMGGVAVGFGSYYSLGDALIRNSDLNGLIVNEGSVGATTFDRFSCTYNRCLRGGKILGYKSQFEDALKRVAIYGVNNPVPIKYNADYIIIGVSNDCIHSDAFGKPQTKTKMCTEQDIEESITNIIDIAKESLKKQITPLISIPPKYSDLNLQLLEQGLHFYWVINEGTYNTYRNELIKRVEDELGKKYILNIWDKFSHRGDGIHPSRKTVEDASKKVVKKLCELEKPYIEIDDIYPKWYKKIKIDLTDLTLMDKKFK